MYVWILDWLYLLVVMISSSKVDEFFPIKGFLVVVYPSHSARVGQTTDVLGLAFFFYSWYMVGPNHRVESVSPLYHNGSATSIIDTYDFPLLLNS
jgi:hypothetical protein